MGEEPCGLDIEYYAMQSELARLTDENAKLRGLAYKAWKAAEKLCNAFPDSCDSSGYDPCPIGEHNEGCVHGQLEREMREAGIEVE